jgi:hypothetical protein
MSTVDIIQVLLLFEAESAHELSPALWATLLEVERFYNQDEPRARFDRYYISPYRPTTSPLEAAWRGFGRLLRGDKGMDDALVLLSQEQSTGHGVESSQVEGKYKGTVDQGKLWTTVRALLGEPAGEKRLLIVTDREITPPPEWRYIIWDGSEMDAVVSFAPIDPKYWREKDPQRVSTIKRRVRTVCLSVTGQFLGLQRCDNPSCFLYKDIEGVTTLDLMTRFGPEHELPSLTNFGFSPAAKEPSVIQRPVESPDAEGSSA